MRYIFRELDADKRRLARGARQRRACRDGRGEARQHRLHDPRAARPRRPRRQQGRHGATRHWADRQGRRPGEALRQDLVVRPRRPAVRRLARRPGQRARSSSGTGSGSPRPRPRSSGPAGRTARWRRPGTRGRWSQKREEPCYSGQYGLFHTGTGATSDHGGNPGPTCDTTTSSVQAERTVFTLNTSIMAVAEAALGRMGTRPAAALHHRQRHGAARPVGVGAARRDAGDRRRRRTSARTSTSCSPSGRWRCRPGAPTASCGRSCTTSSGSPRTSVADRVTRRAAGPGRAAHGGGAARPAGWRCGRRLSHSVGRPAGTPARLAPSGALYRHRAAARCSGPLVLPERAPGVVPRW